MRILFRGGKYIHLKGKFHVLFEKFNMVDLKIIYYRNIKKNIRKNMVDFKIIYNRGIKKQKG